MRTYEHFILEYDANQLKDANPELAALAQRRQQKRVSGGGKGSEGSESPLNSNMPGQKERTRRIEQGKNVGYQGNKSITKRPVTTGTRPNAGGAIVKSGSQLAKTPADKGAAIVRQKQSAPSKDAVGKRAPAQKGYMTSPDGIRKPKNNIHSPTTSRNSQKPAAPGNSQYERARRKRDIKNKLDKEDEKKGRFGRFAKNALGAAGKVGGTVANQARATQQDKGEKMQDAQVSNVKRGIYNP